MLNFGFFAAVMKTVQYRSCSIKKWQSFKLIICWKLRSVLYFKSTLRFSYCQFILPFNIYYNSSSTWRKFVFSSFGLTSLAFVQPVFVVIESHGTNLFPLTWSDKILFSSPLSSKLYFRDRVIQIIGINAIQASLVIHGLGTHSF